MKKRMLSMALTLCLVLSLLPTVALAANISGNIIATTTWNDGDTISGAVNITGGTVDAPVIITVTGTVTVNALITVESGHVKITGTGVLIKGSSSDEKLLEVKGGSTVTLENVTIDGANRSTSMETVHITGGSTLNLGTGAIIQNCERSAQGAAINMDVSSSRLNMADGSSIQNNTSTSIGGVVWIYQGIFTMTGGSITGNKGSGSSGGVYVGGSMEIGGSAVIKDNTLADGVTARNVSLGSNTLTVSGELTAPDGSIGVTRGTGVFAKGKTSAPGYTIVEADKAKFFADDGVSPIALLGGELSFTENYDVFVGATQVTKSNSSDVLNDGTVSYTPAQGGNPQKLTLKGATISGSSDGADGTNEAGAIFARGDLILELAENTVNTVTNNTADDDSNWQSGILVVDGNLTIQSSGDGSGKLIATGGKSTTASFGIGVQSEMLTIKSGTVVANGNECYGGSSGIYANMGVAITGGTVTATGAEASGAGKSRGIEITNGNGDISISGGTVIAKSTDTDAGHGIAMTKAPVLLNDRAVTVASTASDGSSPTPYNETDIGTYKYLEIGEKVPVPPPYTGPSYYYYTLKATAAAGGAISPTGNVSVRERLNKTFKITPDKGFEIDDVLVDGKSVGAVSAYTFEKVVKGHTIEAKFVKIWDNPFTDVTKDDAYYRAVQYVSESGLMIGTAADRFAPKGEISRAMIVTILHRLAGTPAASVPAAFDDLGSDTWYTAALSWGVEALVINGYGNGKFGPADAITREQLVTMLWRLAKSPVPADDTGLSQYGDAGEISPWARPALVWAHQQGLLDCFGPHLLPQIPATRGETAIILEKMNRIS